MNLNKISRLVDRRVENIVRKGENAGLAMFSKAFSVRVVKSRDYVVKS